MWTCTKHVPFLEQRQCTCCSWKGGRGSVTATFIIRVFHTKHTLSCGSKAEGKHNGILTFVFISFLRSPLGDFIPQAPLLGMFSLFLAKSVMLNDRCSHLWSRVLNKWNQGGFLGVHREGNVLTSFLLSEVIFDILKSVCYPLGLGSVCEDLVWQFPLSSTHQICFGNIVLYRDYALSRKIQFSLNYCNLKLETDSCEPTFPNPPPHVNVLMRDNGWVFYMIKSNHWRIPLPPITRLMPERMLGGRTRHPTCIF